MALRGIGRGVRGLRRWALVAALGLAGGACRGVRRRGCAGRRGIDAAIRGGALGPGRAIV